MQTFKPNLEFKNTPRGAGIFSRIDIPKGTIVFEFGGPVLTKDQLPKDTPYILQIGTDKYLGPSGDFDDYFNHSCVPNCGVLIVGNRAFLISIVQIQSGTEITFDYSTTSTETSETWLMNCQCGQYFCRKKISGFKTLPTKLQTYYDGLGIVPDYVKK